VRKTLSDSANVVEGEVSEVLEGFGLAHVRTADGQIFGLTKSTAGIEFSTLRPGIRVRCTVNQQFNRVVYAELIG
jgi:hypothetical protein